MTSKVSSRNEEILKKIVGTANEALAKSNIDAELSQETGPTIDEIVEVSAAVKTPTGPEYRVFEAFDSIARLTLSGYAFTDGQLDVMARALATRLEETGRDWLFQIAKDILNRPLWQVLLGQFLRCWNMGQAQAPTLDGTWDLPGSTYDMSRQECNECHKKFVPDKRGQLYCSNECGVKPEIRAREVRLEKERQEREERQRREDERRAKRPGTVHPTVGVT